MNSENAHLYLPLIQALAEGKTIQMLSADGNSWDDYSDVCFTHESNQYRVKPEPREWLCVVSQAGYLLDAESVNPAGRPLIRVREILP